MSARDDSWSSLVNAATIRHGKNRNREGEKKNDKTADTVVTDAPPQPGESEESIRDGINEYFNPFESSWAPEHGKSRNSEGEKKNDETADTVVTDAPPQPDESEESIRDGINIYFNPFESLWAPEQEKTADTPGAAAEEGNDMAAVQELLVNQTEPATITPLPSNPLYADNSMEIDDREQIDRYPSRKRRTEEDAPKGASKRNNEEADDPPSKCTSNRAAPLKDDEPEIGERVYSCFQNGDWYWGMVKHKFKKGNKFHYSIQYDDGDYDEDFDPAWGLASERHYKAGMEPDDPDACRVDEGTVKLNPPDHWVVRIVYARKNRYLGRFPTQEEATQYLAAVRRILESFGKTKEAVDAMTELQGREAVQRARYEAGAYLGLSIEAKAAKGSTPKERSKAMDVEERTARRMLRLHHTSSGKLRELYKMRCETCELCCRKDCKRCEPCIRNRDCKRESRREICLRKMCCEIDLETKALPAAGFPKGWRFTFDKPKKKEELDGLQLLAPNGTTHFSFDSAYTHCYTSLRDIENTSIIFFKVVGAPFYSEDNQHLLVGRGICQQWTDGLNCPKLVNGIITRCHQKDEGDETDIFFTVKYNESSRCFANSMPNRSGSMVPPMRMLESELAWGGCLLFEDRTISLAMNRPLRSFASPRFCWKWITPEMRLEQVGDTSRNKLPKLTLGVRGYQLVFTVKKSLIPKAGLGVFVKATQCTYGPKTAFELQQGELLDLGIYAPFLITDNKKETAFFVKNFIHSYAPEHWCFDSDEADSMFDITDDHTGDIHEEASRHILAYVNECSNEETPTIRAEKDPEGSVHYLLGNLTAKKLTIPVNGTEIEIFVNYGSQYENVRLREGYSELPITEQKKRLEKLANEDFEYLDGILSFTTENVVACVDFFENQHVKTDRYLAPVPRQRSLKVLEVLGETVQNFRLSDDAADKPGLEICANRIKTLSAKMLEGGTT